MVNEPRSSVPPRITDSRPTLTAQFGEVVELPCAAQGYPIPQYRCDGQLKINIFNCSNCLVYLQETFVFLQRIILDNFYIVVLCGSARNLISIFYLFSLCRPSDGIG